MTPTFSIVLLALWSLITTSMSTPLYNTPFDSLPLPQEWQYDYSYDKHPSDGSVNPDYFNILPSPSRDGNALRVQIFQSDILFSNSSSMTKTCPRSEFSGSIKGKIPTPIYDNLTYVAQWHMYVSKYPTGYNFCFAQVHAPKPANLMLRWQYGRYILTATLNMHVMYEMTGPNAPAGSPTVSEDLHEDMNRWVTWRMEFLLATQGYVKVYRDGSLLGDLRGDTSSNNSTQFWKGGVYSQPIKGTGNCNQQDATAWFKNFQLFQADPSTVPPLQVLSTNGSTPVAHVDDSPPKSNSARNTINSIFVIIAFCFVFGMYTVV